MDTRNITNRSDCVAANYRWVHHKYNFDNLGQVSATCVPPALTRLPSGWGCRLFSANGPGITDRALVLLCQDRPCAFSFPGLSFLFCKMGGGWNSPHR